MIDTRFIPDEDVEPIMRMVAYAGLVNAVAMAGLVVWALFWLL